MQAIQNKHRQFGILLAHSNNSISLFWSFYTPEREWGAWRKWHFHWVNQLGIAVQCNAMSRPTTRLAMLLHSLGCHWNSLLLLTVGVDLHCFDCSSCCTEFQCISLHCSLFWCNLCIVLHCMWDTWWQFGLVAKADLHPLTASWHCRWYCALFCTVLQTALRLHFCTYTSPKGGIQLAQFTMHSAIYSDKGIVQCTVHTAQCSMHQPIYSAEYIMQSALCTVCGVQSAVTREAREWALGDLRGFCPVITPSYSPYTLLRTQYTTSHHT